MIFSAIHWATMSVASTVIVWDVVEINGVRKGRAAVSRAFIHPLLQRVQTTLIFFVHAWPGLALDFGGSLSRVTSVKVTRRSTC